MKDLKNLDWNEIIERLSGFATSEIARTELRKTLPLSTPEEAQKRFQETAEISVLKRHGLRPHMESLDLFASWYQRLTRSAVLKLLEFKDVRHFCLETLALNEILKTHSTNYLEELRTRLMPAEEPLSAIDQIMTPGGDIRSDASEKLHHLNEEKTSLTRQIHNALNKLVKDFQIEHLLQDRFVTTREGRWVLPIKSGMQHSFRGIVHAASQTHQTVFMEPEDVVPTNNRLREVEIEIEHEIERLLIELSNYLATLKFKFDETKKVLVEADMRLAQGELMVHLNAEPCEFTSTKLLLKELRHPLLVSNKKNVVTNTVELNTNRRILVLSGPNAGGKTVLLKAIGLATQMARCGLPICADKGSTLPFFEALIIAIGDSQSVDADLSTFAAHLKTLDYAVKCKGPQTLLLIDEICGSTDPEEGAALARSFIDTYSDNKVFAVITSHLGALKRGWSENSGIINGSLDFDKNSGPTYQFIMGVPGQSLAIQTAKRAGVSDKIINKALTNLSPEQRKYQEGLSDIDRMRQEVLTLQNQLSAELKKNTKQKEKYENLIIEFNKDRENRLEKEVRKAADNIEELIRESKVKDVFRRHENLQQIKYDLPHIIKGVAKSEITDEQKAISSAEDFTKHFPSGSSVYILSLGRDGIVQGQPNSKGEVPVLSSSMRLLLNWRDLKPALQSQNPTQKVLRKSRNFSYSPAADSDRVVDLRGLTSEEAISQLEIQLDAASLGSEDRVKIIHGHGTDTLKRAIRSYLSRSVYVKKWHAGTADTGGDGVTWIEL
ncbi:MAG: DNA mismatch repair protein [Bdellovibrionales bacterium RBG_16_40_8]|nr:MAG: DNA mismatch repair protein [Bdellovibrionales bacterium RBG_16_40_8]